MQIVVVEQRCLSGWSPVSRVGGQQTVAQVPDGWYGIFAGFCAVTDRRKGMLSVTGDAAITATLTCRPPPSYRAKAGCIHPDRPWHNAVRAHGDTNPRIILPGADSHAPINAHHVANTMVGFAHLCEMLAFSVSARLCGAAPTRLNCARLARADDALLIEYSGSFCSVSVESTFARCHRCQLSPLWKMRMSTRFFHKIHTSYVGPIAVWHRQTRLMSFCRSTFCQCCIQTLFEKVVAKCRRTPRAQPTPPRTIAFLLRSPGGVLNAGPLVRVTASPPVSCRTRRRRQHRSDFPRLPRLRESSPRSAAARPAGSA